MLVMFIIFFLVCKVHCNSIILTTKENKENGLEKCVKNIVEKYYEMEKSLTYVDFNADNNRILKILHDSPTVSLISRKPDQKLRIINEGYLINAIDVKSFLSNFSFLQKEANWTPSTRFVIIIEQLSDAEAIFNELLKLHVFHAIVINGTNQADIYTYNPFKNYACGRYFERVISYGPCASLRVKLFFNKRLHGLRNCTFNIAVSHLPPFVIKPNFCKSEVKKYCTGTEQFIFDILGRLEHFKINYTYIDFAEKFSNVDDDMEAVGSFSLIQDNVTDGLFGITLLTHDRAQAFSYIYQHLAFTDQLVYVVKKSGYVPAWKYVYLEFQNTVWIMLFLAFASSTLLLIFMIKPKSKVAVLVKMWDSLFLHGFSVHDGRFTAKGFLIVWISFTFFINSFYQSILMSLTTHPSNDFQISTEDDIMNAKLRPCVLPGVTEFLNVYANMTIGHIEKGCQGLIPSMEKVSKSYEMYTITTDSIYEYNSPLFSPEDSEIYRLKRPVMKAIFAFFLYKGFPWMPKLELRALRLREHGLIDKQAEHIQYYSKLLYEKNKTEFKARVVVPWVLLLVGSVIATFAFIIEVLKPKT